MTEKGPRDRAVCVCSKKALVQTRSEGAKQLAFTNGPFGWTAQEVMSEIAKRFAEVVRPIGEGFDDVERLRECEDTCQSQQKLLPNAMSGS